MKRAEWILYDPVLTWIDQFQFAGIENGYLAAQYRHRTVVL